MRKLRNIFAIIALLSAASCAVDNVDAPSYGVSSSDVVTVMGRMTRFDDKDVTTRGIKDQDEAKLTSMAMAIFKVNAKGDGLDGNCVYYQYADNQAELLFTIERGSKYAYDARYAIYVFCNMPGMSDTDEDGNIIFGVGKTLDEMLAKYYEVQNVDIPTNGFPMMGSLGDTFSTTFDRDNQEFILSPLDENGELTTPKVDGNTKTLLTIPMKAMYAKVNFTIEVRPDQTIEGNYSPQFKLESYTVNNVPSKVDFDNSTNSDTNVLKDSFSRAITGTTVASGANKINFTFYLPERYLTPTINCEEFKYPFGGLNDKGEIIPVEGYSNLRKEDQQYAQRFKSKLVDDSKKATNIVISGLYRDHQNHYWDVDYTIYLGEDNYGDFNIKRNSEYHNYVTIRGIQSSEDMSDNQNGIAIDHRVNVTRTQPAIISLRREVLLDSHFEVRPLRIRKSDVANIPTDITHVKVEVVNAGSAKDKSGTWWMRLERSFGVGGDGENKDIYIKEGVSAGKRKYFTYDLITGSNDTTNGDLAPLTESTEVIVPLNEGEQCVWIYVDECTEVGDAVRAGIVKVTYGSYDGKDFTPANNATYPDVSYVINQRKLFEVKYDDPKTTEDEDRKYHIEFEEEYLHNFDADDNYGQTEYEGMQWGLDGIQLSYDIKAVVSTSGSFDGFKDYFMGNAVPYYDFYNSKDSKVMTKSENRRAFRGYVFSNEIIQVVNGYGNHDTDTSNNIDVLQLDEKPNSAIEYCYNKNKRNRNGQVAWTGNSDNLNWYLPAIDEIEDIVMSKYGASYALNTYARFIDFQAKEYWSSQPAYFQSYMHYSIGQSLGLFSLDPNDYANMYVDNINRARATSVEYTQGQYTTMSSGSGGYYTILLMDGDLGNYASNRHLWYLYDELKDKDVFTYQYRHREPSLTGGVQIRTSKQFTRDSLPTFDDGNKPRNSYARIRCVRKSQYTNTSAN